MDTKDSDTTQDASKEESLQNGASFCRTYNLLKNLRKIITELLVLVIIFFLLFVLYKEFTSETILVAPFEVPNSFEQKGLTGQVIANKLLDEINKINQPSRLEDEAIFMPAWNKFNINIDVKGSGASFDSAIQYIRKYFDLEQRQICGEVVISKKKVYITTRINNLYINTESGNLDGLDILLSNMAKNIYNYLYPVTIAQQQYDNGDDKAFLNTIQKIISTESQEKKYMAYLLWGKWLYEKKDYHGAIDKFKKAIELYSNSKAAYNNWGYMLFELKDYSGAIDKFKKSIKIESDNPHAYNNWGLVLAEQKNYKGAIEKYSKAISLDPTFAPPYNNWGLALNKQNDHRGAIEKYKKAISLDPEFAKAYCNWGVALHDLNDINGAIEMYKKAIKIDPKYVTAYYSLGMALHDKGDYRSAIATFENASKIDPTVVEIYENLGFTLYKQKNYKEAIEMYKKILSLNPKSASAYYLWGVTLEDKGYFSEAGNKYKRAIELSGEDEIKQKAKKRLDKIIKLKGGT